MIHHLRQLAAKAAMPFGTWHVLRQALSYPCYSRIRVAFRVVMLAIVLKTLHLPNLNHAT